MRRKTVELDQGIENHSRRALKKTSQQWKGKTTFKAAVPSRL
jgi:hypothetical protein